MTSVSIHGTSNSVRKGWKEAIYDNPKLKITNFSIGACCSGIALCSALHRKSYSYDINIFELAINDNAWYNNKSISEEHLKSYIDEMFELMLSSKSTVILLIMPDRIYVENINKRNLFLEYYEEKARLYNIPIVNGYRYIDLLKEKISLDVIFFDRMHLNINYALPLGIAVNELINIIIENDIVKRTIDVIDRKKFKYVPAENIKTHINNLVDVSTSLRGESALILGKEKTFEMKTDDFLHGLFLDTNNSKAILKIESSKHTIVINTYRSEIEGDRPQFYYLPLFEPILCHETLRLTIVDNTTPLDQISNSQKEVIVDDNRVILFGLLFSNEILDEKKYFILNDDIYHNMINFIENSLSNMTEKLISRALAGKKKKLIMHVGMPKTGTSSIQKTLHKNLNNPDIIYMPFQSENHGGVICTLFGNEQNILRFNRNKSEYQVGLSKKKSKDLIVRTVTSSDASTFIISGEAIQTLREDNLVSMKNFLYGLFDSVEIVAYVRAPYSFISSGFQQMLKTQTNESKFEIDFPPYKKRFKDFFTVFGQESIRLLKFDPKSFPEGDVVLDFCSRLGIPMMKEKILKTNESLSKEAISLLYVYRKYGPKPDLNTSGHSGNTIIVNVLSRVGTQKFRFSPALIAPVLEEHKNELNWMEERLGETLDESVIHDSNNIESEEELENFALDSVSLLDPIVNKKYLDKDTDRTTLEGVATMVHTIALEAKDKYQTIQKGSISMKTIELAEKIKHENEELLGKMNEKKIAFIVRKALEEIKKQIEETDDSRVVVQGLGAFNVRMVEKEVEGEQEIIKRVLFRSAKEKIKEEL